MAQMAAVDTAVEQRLQHDEDKEVQAKLLQLMSFEKDRSLLRDDTATILRCIDLRLELSAASATPGTRDDVLYLGDASGCRHCTWMS